MSADIASLVLAVDSTQVNKGAAALDELAKASSRAEKSTQSGRAALRSAAEQTASFVAGLERQVALHGRSAAEALRYDASLLGMTRTQRGHTDALITTIAQQERSAAMYATLTRVATTAAIAIGGGLAFAMRATYKATVELEQSMARMNAVVVATGNAAGLTAQQIEDMVQSMEGRTLFDDAAIRDAASALLTFRSISGDTFGKALDMAGQLASVMKTDLHSATMMLGKAMQSPETGLTAMTRAGITFSESEKSVIEAMVEAGNKAGAMDEILRLMAKQGLNDVSEKMRTGVAGSAKAMGDAWDDLLKTVGKTPAYQFVMEAFFDSMREKATAAKFAVDAMTAADSKARRDTGVIAIGSNVPTEQARAIEAAAAQKRADAWEAELELTQKNEKAIAEFAKKAAEQYKAVINKADEFTAALKKEAAQMGLTEIQKKMMDAAQVASTLKTEKGRLAVMSAALALADAMRVEEASTEAKRAATEATEAANKAINDSAQKLGDEVAAAELALKTYGMTRAEIEGMTIARLEENLVREQARDADEATLAYYEKEIAARKRIQAAMIGTDEAKRVADEQKKLWDGIEQAGHDAWMHIGESGQSVLDRLKAMTKNFFLEWTYQMGKKWIMNVGIVSSGAGGSSSAAGGGGTFGASSVGGMFGSGTGFAIADAAQFLSSGSAMGPAAPGTLGSIFAGAGQYSNFAYGLAGLGGGLLGGAIGGETGAMAGSIGASIGMAAGGPIGAAVGSVLGGFVGSLFGGGGGGDQPAGPYNQYSMQFDATAAGLASRSQYTARGPRQDGGQYGAVVQFASAEATALNAAVVGVFAEYRKAADAAGISTAALSGAISTANEQTMKGATLQEAITLAVGDLSDKIAVRLLPNIASYQAAGESLAGTFARLTGDVVAVRDLYSILGRPFAATGEAAVALSEKVVGLFGNLQNLQTQWTSYYAAFYSQGEQTARATEQVSKAIGALGYAMPKTREEFKALVDMQDPASATFAKLIGISQAFAELVPATEAATTAVQDNSEAMKKAADVAAQIAGERYGLETQLLQAQGATVELRARELALLDPSNRALQAQIWATTDATAAAEKAAQAEAEAARVRESAAAQLERETASAAAKQLRAQQALTSGWQRTADSITSTMEKLRGDIAGPSGSFAAVQAQFAIATAAARSGSQDAAGSIPDLATSLVSLHEALAVTRADQQAFAAQIYSSLSGTRSSMLKYGIELPAFAEGTSYIPSDMTARVHAGEEITPRPYVDSQRQARDETNRLLAALRAEIASLRSENSAENRSIAQHTAKTAAKLDRFDDGDAMAVRLVIATTDTPLPVI